MQAITIQRTVAIAMLASSFAVSAQTTLHVASAGSQNMVDYVRTYLAPKFEASHPGVTVSVVGTGPGDAGSQKIYEKLAAQQQSHRAHWDIDVAVVHQKMGGEMVEKGLLSRYRSDIANGKLVTTESAKNALGVNVNGYVMPMFQSQTAIAYNADMIPHPPKSYAQLVAWVHQHPKAFGYNGIKHGMSGVSFVTGWIYNYGSSAKKLSTKPYDPQLKNSWTEAYRQLKAFNQYVTFTPGNAGTLDMLNRGEIFMGPVWVDMFYSWKDAGKLPPSLKLELMAPGMPGQPMYYVIPAKASHKKLAEDFINLATSPQVQANGIVKQFNWYPGIDAKYVKPELAPAVWNKLFKEITPKELAKYSKSFPLDAYMDDIKEGYESQVNN